MVKIRKGNLTAIVPFSTFKAHYENAGWVAKMPKNEMNRKADEIESQNEFADDETDEESYENDSLISSTRIMSMNLEQLRKFAAQNDIDISEANSKKEIRAIIESALGN